jgi:hypothetical protein
LCCGHSNWLLMPTTCSTDLQPIMPPNLSSSTHLTMSQIQELHTATTVNSMVTNHAFTVQLLRLHGHLGIHSKAESCLSPAGSCQGCLLQWHRERWTGTP